MGDRFLGGWTSGDACRERAAQARARVMPAAATLSPEFRSRMERAFGESFADVVVRPSRVVDAVFGGVAVAMDQSILLGGGFFSLVPPQRERVLAHELAHVVQKRRSAGVSPGAALTPHYRARLEAEAHRAAIEATAGRRTTRLLPDAPAIPSTWGPAGHYWTCYFVMLAAGVLEDEAQQRAFFCQMPDQVKEFDAASAEIEWTELDLGTSSALPLSRPDLALFFPSTDPTSSLLYGADPIVSHGLDTRFDPRAEIVARSPEAAAEAMAHRRFDLDIADGLHSLTGGNAGAELIFREEQLRLFAHDPLIFGLALHAFGDSYQHADMDSGGLARRGAAAGAGGGAGQRRDSSSSDSARGRARAASLNSGAGGSSLYGQYVGNLYKIVCEALGTDRNRQIGESAVLNGLREVSDMSFVSQEALRDDPDRQRRESLIIRDAIRRALNRDPSSSFPYSPEDEDEVSWSRFWPRYPDVITRAGGEQVVFDQVRKMGHLWRA